MFLPLWAGIWCWERQVAKIVSCSPLWISSGKTDSLWVCSLFHWYLRWFWGRRAHPNILTIKTGIFSDCFWIVELIMEGWGNGLSFFYLITFYKAYTYTYANIYVYRYMCVYMTYMKWKSLSHVQLFATILIVAHQAPLSMEIFRQEYWCGSPFPSPGDWTLENPFPSQPGDWTHISYVSCIDRWVLYH